VQTVAAAIAAAALLQASPASAGVVLEQPQLKKVFQDDGTPAAPAPKKEIILPGMRSKAAPATKAEAKAAAPKKQDVSEQGGDLDPKSIALPASLALIAGGAFAWSKVDEDFEEFFTKASVKDSSQLGAGYEPDLKGGNGVVAKKKTVAGSKAGSRAGTKKVKAAKSAATSPLSSLFGSKDD